jgi:sensor c-di-GMP phosphodiesterase-like protein
MHILQRRLLVTLTVLVITTVCGILAGLAVESELELRSTRRQLDTDAGRLLAVTDAIVVEANAALEEMNASHDPECSETELTHIRKLIFHLEYVRDAGHMRDGRIACSAAMGREDLPRTQFKPAASLPDGSKIYDRLEPYQTHSEIVFCKQKRDAYVVLGPLNIQLLDRITTRRAITVLDTVSNKYIHPGPQLPSFKGVVTYANWQGQVGNTLFATRCSTHSAICMTDYANLPDPLSSLNSQFQVYGAIGGLIGVMAGMAFALLYRRSRSMAQQLRRAIRRGDLTVNYQPIVEIMTGRIVGAEALARWTDEEGLAVSPDLFIKIAEERGFVRDLTRVVMRQALRDFAQTLRRRPEFKLCVNVAPGDLEDQGLLPMVEQALKWANVQARSLVLEITERSTARHDVAIDTIRKLRARGHAVHIDDFGTGYSSLSYLHELSVNAIKIDKSFTRAIGTGSVTMSILPQILAMANALNLQVIVEGIETAEQAEYFSHTDRFMLAQGWLFGRPVPANIFHQTLVNQESKVFAPFAVA